MLQEAFRRGGEAIFIFGICDLSLVVHGGHMMEETLRVLEEESREGEGSFQMGAMSILSSI